MNSFAFELLNHPMMSRLGWTLLHTVWQGIAAAALLAVLLLLLRHRSSAARYLAALVVMSALTLAVFATFALTAVPVPAVPSPLSADSATVPVLSSVPSLPSLADPTSPSLRRWLDPLLPWVTALWLVGVATMSLGHVGGWLRLVRLRNSGTSLSDPWRSLLDRCADRLHVSRPVALVQSSLVDVPTLIGYLKPLILLPPAALTGLSLQQVEGILAHELAHIRRHDYVVNLLQVMIETVLFYHPAVWWIGRVIRQERENCCDDIAAEMLGDRRGYAAALVSMEELRIDSKLVLAARGGMLLPRVRRLLGLPGVRRAPRLSSLVAAVAMACLVTGPLIVSRVFAQTPRPRDASANREPTTRAIVAAEVAVALTPRETQNAPPDAILRRRLTEINFSEAPLVEVIGALRDMTATNIFVNWKALEAAGIEKSAPISAVLRDVEFGKALDVILHDAGGGGARLGFVIDRGVITISTDNDLSDLVGRGLNFSANTAAAGAPVAASPSAPLKAVRLTLTADGATLQGKPVALDLLSRALDEVPERGEAVLEIAVDSEDVPVGRLYRAIAVGATKGFRYVSQVGVSQPAAGRGSQPAATSPARAGD